jgi:hypothetical protein
MRQVVLPEGYVFPALIGERPRDFRLCWFLIAELGVAAIPPTEFCTASLTKVGFRPRFRRLGSPFHNSRIILYVTYLPLASRPVNVGGIPQSCYGHFPTCTLRGRCLLDSLEFFDILIS